MAKLTPTVGDYFTRMGAMGPTGVLSQTVSPFPTAVDVVPPDTEAYRTRVMADNPFAYWRLGETSIGAAVDEVGNNHGAYLGSPTFGEPGLVFGNDTAIGLTGDEDAVNVGVLGGFAAKLAAGASFELWVQTSNDAGTSLIGIQGTDLNLEFAEWPVVSIGYIKGSPSQLLWNWRQGSAFAALGVRGLVDLGAGAFVDGARHHLVWTITGAPRTLKCYLDSVEQTVALSDLSFGDINEFVHNFHLGNAGLLNPSPYIGTLDEVAIYDSVLTAAQVLAHYNAGIAVQGTTLDGKVAQALTLNSRAAQSLILDGVVAADLTQDGRAAQPLALDGVVAGPLTLDGKADNL